MQSSTPVIELTIITDDKPLCMFEVIQAVRILTGKSKDKMKEHSEDFKQVTARSSIRHLVILRVSVVECVGKH